MAAPHGNLRHGERLITSKRDLLERLATELDPSRWGISGTHQRLHELIRSVAATHLGTLADPEPCAFQAFDPSENQQ